VRPSLNEIFRTLQDGARTRIPGQDAVRVDLGNVRVIINESNPLRSTAVYR
jgi:hypothetical protein